MLPGGDTFVRYLGLFLYFTEWYFDPVGRISPHLKLFRKIPSRNVLICRSSVSSLGMSHRPRLCTLSKHTTPQKIAFRNFLICRGSSVVCRVTGLHSHSTLERSKHTLKYRQNRKAAKIFFAPAIRFMGRESKQRVLYTELFACY